MVPVLIKDLLSSKPEGQQVKVCGWIRSVRDSKGLVFIQVNDGSCFANIQLTFDRNNPSPTLLRTILLKRESIWAFSCPKTH